MFFFGVNDEGAIELLNYTTEEWVCNWLKVYPDDHFFVADLTTAEPLPAYDGNGDVVARDGDRFRQIGWRINGGTYDGQMVDSDQLEEISRKYQIGGYSPVYVEVGRD